MLKNTKPSVSGSVTSRATPPPPPVRRTLQTKQEVHAQDDHEQHIDWTNLSQEDKEVFFSWLDEFFGRFNGSVLASSSADASQDEIHADSEDTTQQLQEAPSGIGSAASTNSAASNNTSNSSRGPPVR